MVKILSLSFRVRNFLPGENPGQPLYTVGRSSSPPRGNAMVPLGLGTSPASPGASSAVEGARGSPGDGNTPAPGFLWSTPRPRGLWDGL